MLLLRSQHEVMLTVRLATACCAGCQGGEGCCCGSGTTAASEGARSAAPAAPAEGCGPAATTAACCTGERTLFARLSSKPAPTKLFFPGLMRQVSDCLSVLTAPLCLHDRAQALAASVAIKRAQMTAPKSPVASDDDWSD